MRMEQSQKVLFTLKLILNRSLKQMKLFEITFHDEVEAEKVEDVYEWLLTYMEICIRNEDVEAFGFKQLDNTSLKPIKKDKTK